MTHSDSGSKLDRIVVSLQRFTATLILAITVLMSAVSIDRAHAIVLRPIVWLFAGSGVVAAIEADAVASHFLDNTRPFIINDSNIPRPSPAWNAVRVKSFKSFSSIRDALQLGTLRPGLRGVVYDYEKWQFTPLVEQRNPAPFVKQAADLVHAHGLLFLTAPAVDLVTVMAPGNPTPPDDLYIQLGIAADAAQYADVFDIQAQRFEVDASRYVSFVQRAAAQARQANPKVVVLAGLSTQPSGQTVTADDILRAIAATLSTAIGSMSQRRRHLTRSVPPSSRASQSKCSIGCSIPRCPLVERCAADPVLAAHIGRLRTSLLLPQNPDDLRFREPARLHVHRLRGDGP